MLEVKRLLANFLSMVMLKGLDFIIPLVTLPYLIKTVGLENFGLINFALSFAFYFGAIAQFGFGNVATREIAKVRDDSSALGKLFSCFFQASILLGVACFFLGIVLLYFMSAFNVNFELFLWALTFLILQSIAPNWFFLGVEKMKWVSVMMLISRLFYIVSLFAFVTERGDYYWVPVINAVAAAGFLLTSLLVVRFGLNIKIAVVGFDEIFSALKRSANAFAVQFMPNLYNNTATFLMGIFASNEMVGIFSTATKIVDAVTSLAYILSNTFYPILARNIKLHGKFSNIMWLAGGTVVLCLLFAASYIAEFLVGKPHADLPVFIRLIAISALPVFVMLIYGTNYLMLTGHDYLAKLATVQVSVAAFFTAIIIVPWLQIWGAAAVIVGARFALAMRYYQFYAKVRSNV